MRKSFAFLALLAAALAFWAGRVTARPESPDHKTASRPEDTVAVRPTRPGPPGASTPSAATPAEMRGSVAPLVERVKGAVVTIQSTKIIRRVVSEDPWTRMLREQFGGGQAPVRENRVDNLGSGFIIDRQGSVLTNNHVVAGADEVVVRLADDRKLDARVLGSDPATDVALVQILKPPADVQPASLGDSDKVRVGDYVLAIGNPLGLGQTVTMGIVSAKNRMLGDKLADLDPRYQDFIQTDAAINQGNSGGPLFSFQGEVVGVNSAIINPGYAMNVGFAIPINLARQIGETLRKAGRVARGYLGVRTQDSTPEAAAQMRVPFAAGALITSVDPGGPAHAAGLRPNDVIVELSGRAVESSRRLAPAVAALRPGDKAKIVYMREGRRTEAMAVLVSQPEAGEAFLGVVVRPLEARESAQVGLKSGEGVVVVSVNPRSPASSALEEGDLILEVNRRPLRLEDIKKIEGVLESGGGLTLTIQRGRHRHLLNLGG